MHYYRVYTLDRGGHIDTGWGFESLRDDTALETAAIMVTVNAKAEVWRADTLVGRISGGTASLNNGAGRSFVVAR